MPHKLSHLDGIRARHPRPPGGDPEGFKCPDTPTEPDPFWEDVLFVYRNQDDVALSGDNGNPLDDSLRRTLWNLGSDNEQKTDFGAFCNRSLFCGGDSINSGGNTEILFEDEQFYQSDFTMECWVAINAYDLTDIQQFIHQWRGTTLKSYRFYFGANAVPNLRFDYSTAGTDTINAINYIWNPVIDQFYHVAIVRDGQILNAYLDGVNVASYNMGSDQIRNSSNDTAGIGLGFQARSHFSGIRLTKAVRYTGTFTPKEFVKVVQDKGAEIDPNYDDIAFLVGAEKIRNYNGGSPYNEARNLRYIQKGSQAFIETTTGAVGSSNNLNLTGAAYSERFTQLGAGVDLGLDDFTMEVWFRSGNTSTSDFRTFIANRGAGATQKDWAWYMQSGDMRFNYSLDGINLVTLSSTAAMGSSYFDEGWYYFACIRDSGQLQFWIEGSQLGDDIPMNFDIHFGTGNILLGNVLDFTTGSLRGRLDEVRFTPGIVRDVSVVPQNPFPRGRYELQR